MSKLTDILRKMLKDSGKKEFTLAEVMAMINHAEFRGCFRIVKSDDPEDLGIVENEDEEKE